MKTASTAGFLHFRKTRTKTRTGHKNPPHPARRNSSASAVLRLLAIFRFLLQRTPDNVTGCLDTANMVRYRLLENKNFAAVTNMIAHYFDDTLAAGYAAQNQMFATLSALLMGEAKQHPEDREAIAEAAKTVSVSRMPIYQADLTAIQNAFTNVLKEIKKEIGSNVSDAQTMSKEAAQQMYADLTKGQDVTKPNVTPEMVAGAITGSVSGMDGVDPEALKQFNQALIGLLTVKPTEDEHDGS